LGNVKTHFRQEMLQFDCVPDGSISAVVMIHVLDHLIEPAETLRRMSKKLKPGALLLLVTHDERSLLAKLAGPRWPAFCLQHPQLYNPKSMRALLERLGFRSVKTDKTYNHFPLMYLAKHLLWALGIKVGSLPLQDKFALPLKLGNIVTLATFSGKDARH
jgi:hypothetical protein